MGRYMHVCKCVYMCEVQRDTWGVERPVEFWDELCDYEYICTCLSASCYL